MSEPTNYFFESDFYKQYSDPYIGYKDSFNEMASKQRSPEIQFGRLCYEVFIMSPEGRQLWELLKDNILYASHFDPREPNPEANAAYLEGQKVSIRKLHAAALQHQERIAHQERAL